MNCTDDCICKSASWQTTNGSDIDISLHGIKIVKYIILEELISTSNADIADINSLVSEETLESENDFSTSCTENQVHYEFENPLNLFSFGTIRYSVPTPKAAPTFDGAVATSLMVAGTIHNHVSPRLLRVQFD